MKNIIKNLALACTAVVAVLCTSCAKPTIDELCNEVNKVFPQDLGNGLKVVSVSHDNDYFMYNYENDESVLTTTVLEDEDGTLAQNFYKEAEADKDLLKEIASYNLGIKWNIKSTVSGDTYYFYLDKETIKELSSK